MGTGAKIVAERLDKVNKSLNLPPVVRFFCGSKKPANLRRLAQRSTKFSMVSIGKISTKFYRFQAYRILKKPQFHRFFSSCTPKI